MAKLDVRSFGLAWGIVTAGFMLLLGVLNTFVYWETGLYKVLAMIGKRPSVLGLILNAAWGFVFSFAFGCLTAWLYNRLVEESREDIEKRIKEVALSIWESKGRPEGSSADDWREAERRVKGI